MKPPLASLKNDTHSYARLEKTRLPILNENPFVRAMRAYLSPMG